MHPEWQQGNGRNLLAWHLWPPPIRICTEASYYTVSAH